MLDMFNGAISFNQDLSGWNVDRIDIDESLFTVTEIFCTLTTGVSPYLRYLGLESDRMKEHSKFNKESIKT